MKNNLQSDIKAFFGSLEKFSARWQQVKKDLSFEGDKTRCEQALVAFKDKKEEFEELYKTQEQLK